MFSVNPFHLGLDSLGQSLEVQKMVLFQYLQQNTRAFGRYDPSVNIEGINFENVYNEIEVHGLIEGCHNCSYAKPKS